MEELKNKDKACMTSSQKEKLLSTAKTLFGKPYRYGAEPEEAPEVFDCSSLTQYLFKQIGIELPRNSIAQAGDIKGKEIIPELDFKNLETGDLLFMRRSQGYYNDSLFPNKPVYVGHVGMYAGQGKIIHASSAQGGVTEQNITELAQRPNYAISLVKRF